MVKRGKNILVEEVVIQGEKLFKPACEAAIYACYLTRSDLLTSRDLKALQLLGHTINQKDKYDSTITRQHD